MREIKFKCKTVTGEWVYGDLIHKRYDPHPCKITAVQWNDDYGFIYTVRGTDFGKTVREYELVFDTDEERQNLLNKCEIKPCPKPISLPDGYEFRDENGNVINATKIVLEKKKEYPRTYEECCKVLGINARDLEILDNMLDTSEMVYCKNLDRLLNSFRKLLICRDAYWKLYGEEMGLGKSWEPDWNNVSDKHCIYFVSGYAWSKECQTRQCPFAFPSAEMRDAFYENFKELIQFVKELL